MTIVEMESKEEILKEIDSLDLLSIRPLRAMMIGSSNRTDIEKLKSIEKRIEVLRLLMDNMTIVSEDKNGR